MHLPYHKQVNGYNCGPATLQMLFEYFGIKKTQSELAEYLETNPEIGTKHKRMIGAVTNENLFCYVNNDSTLEEVANFLEKDLPVVVHYIEPDTNEGHYSIIKKIENGNVIMNDPWNGEDFSLEEEEFKKRWSSEDSKHENWILVASKEDFNLGRQYLPN